jgi:ribosome-associated protein
MNFEVIKKEVNYKAVRSSGAGGQNVNKVSTKIIISFNIQNSIGLSISQKQVLQAKLSNKLATDGDILISCSDTRSQLKNKQIALNKLYIILEQGLKVKAKRIETKVPKAVIKKRLENKKINSLKKNLRKNINL